MDCKHEIEPDIEFIGSHYVLGYKCEKCSGEWSENEVVILPKAQHNRERDVIEVAKQVDKKLFPSHLLREKIEALQESE